MPIHRGDLLFEMVKQYCFASTSGDVMQEETLLALGGWVTQLHQADVTCPLPMQPVPLLQPEAEAHCELSDICIGLVSVSYIVNTSWI